MSRTFYAALFAGLLLGACGDEAPVIFSHSPQPSSEAGAANGSAAGGAPSRIGTAASGARPGGAATASSKGAGGTRTIAGMGGTSGAMSGVAGMAGTAATGGVAGAAGSSGNGTGVGGNAAGAAGISDGGAHDAAAGHPGVHDGGTDAGCAGPLPEGVEPAPAKPPRCDDPPMMCPPGTKPYVSACGCGCQQGGDCPREVHCGGPGPSDPLCTDMNRCPDTIRRR
jgi:hypothetical protein